MAQAPLFNCRRHRACRFSCVALSVSGFLEADAFLLWPVSNAIPDCKNSPHRTREL